MNCYDCLPASHPAVAVCCLCGKGVCIEHCVRQGRTVLEHVPSGMSAQIRRTGRSLPRMVCQECAEAVGTSDSAGSVAIR
jgi:hypothetical protein